MTDSTPTTVDRVIKVVQRVHGEAATVGPESHLAADLGLQSLQMLELISELEDEFGIFIPLSEIPSVPTVGEIAAQIASLLERQGRT
jgi:acyl carrier protein